MPDKVRVNLNDMARQVVFTEGLKKSVSIAQVKEIMRILIKILKQLSVEDLADVFRRYD